METLRATKTSIEAQIEAEEAEKARLQREVERMSRKISQLTESLDKKSAARASYEHTIQETESAYMKVSPPPLARSGPPGTRTVRSAFSSSDY